MEKKKIKFDDHFYGCIFLGLAIVLIVLVPVIMCIALETLPNFLTIAKCIFPLITFIIGGFIEVITYSPMLGVSGFVFSLRDTGSSFVAADLLSFPTTAFLVALSTIKLLSTFVT